MSFMVVKKSWLVIKNNFIKIPILTGLLILFACSSTNTRLLTGENIVLPKNDKIANWKESTIDMKDYQLTLWQSLRGDLSDSFSLRINNQQEDLAVYRKLIDSAGGSQCQQFSSELLDYPNSTDYPALFWLADCQKADGTKLQRLYLILKGKDKFYHLQRNWENSLVNTDVMWWQQYFTRVYVCNTNDQPTTCPVN